MTIKEQLLKEIEATSESTLQEVLNFLLFLKARQSQENTQNLTSTAPHSTARYILDNLENIGTWEGDDFEECLQMVRDSRSKVNFSKYEPF